MNPSEKQILNLWISSFMKMIHYQFGNWRKQANALFILEIPIPKNNNSRVSKTTWQHNRNNSKKFRKTKRSGPTTITYQVPVQHSIQTTLSRRAVSTVDRDFVPSSLTCSLFRTALVLFQLVQAHPNDIDWTYFSIYLIDLLSKVGIPHHHAKKYHKQHLSHH